jgi:hypothetical protein
MKRMLTIEEGIAIIDGAMRSRAITDEARTVWRTLRAALLQREEMLRVIERMRGEDK